MRPRASTLEVILANVDGVDRSSLEVILQGTPWVVINAEPLQIENVVRDASVPIVLCDCDHSECWRKSIRALIRTRRDVCVILLSNEIDPPGCEEVVRYGGFDILTRPLHRKQVLPMLLFAYTYWRGHGPYLSRRRYTSSPSKTLDCISDD
jgi:AmiR/NasT family two-component response regulator